VRRKLLGPKSTKAPRPRGKTSARRMQAAEAKHKDAMEAVKEFNEARDKEKEPSGPQNGSQ